MEAVTTGLIGGSVASLLVIVGGAVALGSNAWEKFSTPYFFFAWMTILSGLTVGQLYLTYSLVSDFSASPTQTEKATIS